MTNISRLDVIINRNRIAARRFDSIEANTLQEKEILFDALENNRRYGTPVPTSFKEAVNQAGFTGDISLMVNTLDLVYGYLV